MTLKIKFTLDDIKLVDYDILSYYIKDALTKILDFGKYEIFNNTILAKYDEEVVDVLYILNTHFDLFIVKGE